MKFLRLAMLSFDPPLGSLEARGFSISDVIVSLREVRGREDLGQLMAIAEIEVPDRLPLNEDNEIEVPQDARRSAEQAIEIVANTVAVCGRAARSISTPNPPAAFIPPDDETRRWLDGTRGAAVTGRGVPGSPAKVELDNRVMEMLADRPDGAALLAEALSHSHATGKFHEFVRLFERAFRLGPYSLIDPLSEFLAPGPFGYTRDEVKQWIDLRQPATHADRRSMFVLEADVLPVIRRMEQAAYDVLFNKATWRGKSTTRRSAWSPTGGTFDARGSIFQTQGKPGTLQFQMFDIFGRYPQNLAAGMTERPAEWWWRSANEVTTEEDPDGES